MELVVRVPLRTGGYREALLVEGPCGWGECSPLPGYPCSPERARAAADESACHPWPPPLRPAIPVNALIPAVAPDEAAELAVAAVAGGFRCLKLKVAGATLDTVAAVRQAVGPSTALRIDVNGAWDVDQAVAALNRLRPYDLELVEQPVASLEDLAAVRRRVDVRLAADECVRSVEDARRLRRLDAADVIVLKVQPLGGVRPALEVAEAAGVPAIVTSMLETSVGLAAGAALAAALPDLPYACGLATASVLAADVVAEPLVPSGGVLRVRRPEPDPDLLARYRVAA